MNNVLVIGDSWSSAVEAGTGFDEGWPAILGVEPHMRQAVAGFTAAQWAADIDGRLTHAVQTPSDVVIMSLLGNDALQALADGRVEANEIVAAANAYEAVLRRFTGRRIITILYADPFSGNRMAASLGVPALNGIITMVSARRAEHLRTSDFLRPEHFLPPDIHPTRAGHELIARHLAAMLAQPATTRVAQ